MAHDAAVGSELDHGKGRVERRKLWMVRPFITFTPGVESIR